MNALPCYAERAVREYQRVQDAKDQHEARAERLAEEMAQTYTNDLQIVSECTGDVLFYNPEFTDHHPQVIAILALIRDGNDDAELGRLLREATKGVISKKAAIDAEDLIAQRNDATAIASWENMA
ncbi:hypothetical protein [Dyella sp.]|uniref:hypothetical protein n=1 Tax=Dyella sp. TaxID=1869338 RepID=UPI00284B9340|nr:hypothetical protein [Dyella sp.]MDR3445957.1 hypothetical protein [Dyella sp.]